MLNVAKFANQSARHPKQLIYTWQGFRDTLLEHEVFPVPNLDKMAPGSDQWDNAIKDARATLPLFSPVLYKPGATRGNAGVEEVSCFICDLDDVSAEEVAALRDSWKAPDGSPLAWALYSTSKHRTEAPRVRVIFPLFAPVPAADWPRVWLKLTYNLTENRNDKATKDLARLHFLPIVPDGCQSVAFTDFSEGGFVDPSLYPDPPEASAVENIRGRGEIVGISTWKSEGKPGFDFNEKSTPEDILSLLMHYGWQEHSRRGSAVYVTRAGKDPCAGISGVIGWPGDPSPVFYCFTSSATPLEARAYAPFGLFAILAHGADFAAAAKVLGAKGYGDQSRSTRVSMEQIKHIGTPLSLGDLNKTDAGNAERLIARHGADIRWVSGLGWRVWDGKRWAADDTAVTAYARSTIRTLYGQAAELLADAHKEQDMETRKQLGRSAEELSRFAIKSESTRALAAMVDQARSFSEIKISHSAYNVKPWIIPFQNGVWDRGCWREHRRDDYIEDLLPVSYDPKADRSEWLTVLARITGGDALFARTLQETSGYIISGASTLRVLPWAYGKTGTGKSTWAELLITMLGSMGDVLDWSLISGHREAEKLGAAVRGKRLLVLPEAAKKRLSAETLKSLSGSDRIPCRLLYSSVSFSVKPSWVLLAVSNDSPSTNAHDEALRGRIMALPFIHSFDDGPAMKLTGSNRIEEVRQMPGSDLVTGFVAWVIDGLEHIYKHQEIYRAPVVIKHTCLFWQDTDPLTPFWEGFDQAELERGILSSVLHQSYVFWCQQQGIKNPVPQGKNFAAACRAGGLEIKKTNKGALWFLSQPAFSNDDFLKVTE